MENRQTINQAHMARLGFWYCQDCERVTEPEHPGEPHQRCGHADCRSHRVVWREPIFPETHTA